MESILAHNSLISLYINLLAIGGSTRLMGNIVLTFILLPTKVNSILFFDTTLAQTPFLAEGLLDLSVLDRLNI